MKSVMSLEGISDGKLYDIEDMVKADASGCNGCSSCCQGVGELFSLSPYDVYEIRVCLKKSFEELLEEVLILKKDGKLIIPHLGMNGDNEKCSFLDLNGRCSIHSHRPNICRLFPLGRVYENNDFKYFLQVGNCKNTTLQEVKVRDWLGIEDYEKNKEFILMWHNIIKAMNFRMKFVYDEEEVRQLNDILIDSFYKVEYEMDKDFYSIFNRIIPEAKKKLGII